MLEKQTDILIVGASTGGCAAALGALSLGCKVILAEELDWIGGQFTSQCVPPDEHPWIEQFGCTRRYRSFREGVRSYYRHHYPLIPTSRVDPLLNPGKGFVSKLCCEPRVALAVLEQMIAYYRSRGQLEVLTNRKPVNVEVDADRIESVTFDNIKSRSREVITAKYFLDATELGDLLSLGGVEYYVGAESQDQTNEPHAKAGLSQPDNVQAFTWCLPISYDPKHEHLIERPEQYEMWRDYIPTLTPPWSGKLLSWAYPHPVTQKISKSHLFKNESEFNALNHGADQKSSKGEWHENKVDLHDLPSMWVYRRILSSKHFCEERCSLPEVTVLNWPQNDYFKNGIIDKSEDEINNSLYEASQLSLSLLYWLQTEAENHKGGYGYPGLYLRKDVVGTDDGLAKFPYIRESRRIQAIFTITENHIAYSSNQSGKAQEFYDSVGVGAYRIDLHPSTGGDNYIDISTCPFQIPLGALLPIRVENLLPACKNIGTTHISNGCYRMHPTEWNIGETVGILAAFCINRLIKPLEVREKQELLRDFQKQLTDQGIEISWTHINHL